MARLAGTGTLLGRALPRAAADVHPADAAHRTPPSGDPWTFELKWDGCRAQLRYDGRSASLRTCNGRECSADFPEPAAIASALGSRRVTLDGELVCLRSDGRPDFARLRRRLTGSANRRYPAVLQVFDVLHLNGHSTRVLPYAKRRALLEELALEGPAWRTPASVVVERSEDFAARVEELGLEGVVAKRLGSTYLAGRRCTSWVKHKLRREERLAVTGIRRTRHGHVEAIFVARAQPDGSFIGAGAVELGPHRARRAARAPPREAANPPARSSRRVSARGVGGCVVARTDRRTGPRCPLA